MERGNEKEQCKIGVVVGLGIPLHGNVWKEGMRKNSVK